MRGDRARPAIVYLAVNKLNGKRYVGVTTRGIRVRSREHAMVAARGVNNGAFYRALRKYGAGSFEWSVLEECADAGVALKREMDFISDLSPEYNSTLGGDGVRGLAMSADARAKMSIRHRGNTYRLGKSHSDETRTRLRELAFGNKESWGAIGKQGPEALSKAVVCIDNGQQYSSASAAARAFSLSKSAVIEVCQRHPRRKTAGGMVFRYFGDHSGGANEASALKDLPRPNNRSGLRGVECHSSGKWKASISVDGTRHYLGLFADPASAHAAYCKAAQRLRGA